nr:MarR family transcriptional regulator [Kineosporia mesophila]
MSDALDVSGISAEQWRVLSVLVPEPGLTMSEIAFATSLPAPSISRLVDKLVSDNWIYRRTDSLDRRRILVTFSARGRTRMKKLERQGQLLERELAQAVGAEELASALAVLGRLSAYLET